MDNEVGLFPRPFRSSLVHTLVLSSGPPSLSSERYIPYSYLKSPLVFQETTPAVHRADLSFDFIICLLQGKP